MTDRALQAVATIEGDLRATDGVEDVAARVDDSSARLYWDTWEPNEGLRGEVLASVCTAVARSIDWRLVTVHDPMEREQHVSNCVTIQRCDDGVTVRSDPARGPPRRTTLKPADARAGYRRCEREWTGCQWRATGQERLDDAVVTPCDQREGDSE
jgi:hypothetical protein